MHIPRLALAAVFASVLISAAARPQQTQQKGGEEETGPYEVAANWPQPIAAQGYVWGSQGGVFAESANRVYLLNRGELKLPEKLPNNFNGYYGSIGSASRSESAPDVMRNCIVVVDAKGKMLESWTQWDHLFEGGRGPHTIKISPYDPQRHVWVVDDMRQEIFEFTNDGKKLVTTLGVAGVAGEDDKHFGRPTDIAWLKDGTFFVSDGYTNTRVVKFDKDGKFLMAWGTKGTEPGQFRTPHSIATDPDARRVYVADRTNGRIQVFDENGKFLDQWPNIRSAYHIFVTADHHLWIADGVTDKFLKYDLNGKLLYSWGTHGTFPGAFWAVHQFSVDADGNLYAAETFGGRTQKFVPKAGADSAKLVGKPVPLMAKVVD
jgi:DNA-binding beta-propeller fold protein YncE